MDNFRTPTIHPQSGHAVLPRFDVAMRDSGTMRTVERVGDLDGESERLIERVCPLLDAGGQSLALHVLHHHVTGAILIADVVEHADVRMVQRSHRASFAFETSAQIFALGDVLGQDLDGDAAVEARVASFVHLHRLNACATIAFKARVR